MVKMRMHLKILVWKPKHRWENNIKMDLKETGLEGMNWILLAQDRFLWQALVNTKIYLQVL
jgi:hypothetical protein